MLLPVFEIYTHKDSGAQIETHPWGHRDGRQMIGFTRTYPPRTGKGPAHVHSDNEQRNIVRFGIARYRIGKETGELGPGDELVIPPGTPHVDPYNDTDEALQMTTFFSPGSAWMVMFGRTLAQAIRDGNVDQQQQLKPLHLMVMMTAIDHRGGTLHVTTESKDRERAVSEPRRMLIGGEWVASESGATFETVDPATGEVLAEVPEGDAADIDRAVAAARATFEQGPWREMTPAARGRLLWRIADLIDEHTDELAVLESLDNGKPLTAAKTIDVPAAADIFRYMAGWATKVEGNTIPISVDYMPGAEFHAYTEREPVGVVGQIIPWNFPLVMAGWKLAPALAVGCTSVLKPAEQTPLTALRLGELMHEAGLPPGAVNVVPGYGETAGAALAAHPDVDKVAFTGSTEVGRLIVRAAAENLKRVSLELGGKSPNVVFADADLEQAIPGAAAAIFMNSGQVCGAGSRLYVEESVFDTVVEAISGAAQRIKVGHGREPDTEIGPIISDVQEQRVMGFVNAARNDGAEIVTGGNKLGEKGYFMEPTVVVNARPDMAVVTEEIFGPVVVALPFKDPAEIPAAANSTIYGLAAGIWTRDISKAHRTARRLKAGTVWVNCYHVYDSALPFGGYKQSGWGREMGRDALDLYTQKKSVCVQL